MLMYYKGYQIRNIGKRLYEVYRRGEDHPYKMVFGCLMTVYGEINNDLQLHEMVDMLCQTKPLSLAP